MLMARRRMAAFFFLFVVRDWGNESKNGLSVGRGNWRIRWRELCWVGCCFKTNFGVNLREFEELSEVGRGGCRRCLPIFQLMAQNDGTKCVGKWRRGSRLMGGIVWQKKPPMGPECWRAKRCGRMPLGES